MIEPTMELYDNIFEWGNNGNIGISSNTMLFAVTGKSLYGESRDIPYDAGDFKRCLDLCSFIPEIELNLKMVAEKYPKWIPIVREWYNLKRLYKKSSDDLYKALRDLRDECMEHDGWVKESSCSWRKKGSS